MNELVSRDPIYIGATNAAKASMGGGVWFIKDEPHPMASTAPQEVQQKLVSTKNPKGTVTNLDLELAATIAQHHILEEAYNPMAVEIMHNFCNNTPAIAWQTKGLMSTTQMTANTLCHTALHQRDIGHFKQYEHLAEKKMSRQMMPTNFGIIMMLLMFFSI
jgi:hypothetical protein